MSVPFLKTNTNKQEGFTLIEFLLYLALLVSMIGIIGNMGILVLESRIKSQAQREMDYSVHLVFSKLSEAIENGEDITAPIRFESATSLSVISSDARKNPTVFDVVDGRMRMQEGISEPVYISSSGAFITDVTFTNISHEDTPASVRTHIRFDAYGGKGRLSFIASTSFYSTIQIRK